MPETAAVNIAAHGQVVDFIAGWPDPVRGAISRRFPPGIQSEASPHPIQPFEPAFARGFNLGAHVGDAVGRVGHHRSLYARAIGSRPVWLNQVHEKAVLNLDHLTDEEMAALDQSIQSDHTGRARGRVTADACFTTQPGRACTIMFADCLAVLVAHSSGNIVGAAHAGWRGLAGGVLGALLEQMNRNCPSGAVGNQWLAWLGPCIGPKHFEVGPEVVKAMVSAGLKARTTPGRGDRVHLNLQDLAVEALLQAAAGLEGEVEVLGQDPRCTYSDEMHCFSHRRDGQSGRMAASIWLFDEAK